MDNTDKTIILPICGGLKAGIYRNEAVDDS